jgi:outer membrane receptor protein involved in Fe transport
VRLALAFLLSCAASSAVLPAQEAPPPAAAQREDVIVTATRAPEPAEKVAASVAVVSAADLAAQASPALDVALRQVPGFTLFRRTDSRYANPTAQGVSLRGVGASGASRALVVDDGIPINDAFGGWVYWGEVPREEIERVEVLRGGGADLYGGPALAGVVRLFRRSATLPMIDAEASGGSEGTAEGSLFAALASPQWSVSGGADGYRTDGFVAVRGSERGPVDVAVRSRHAAGDVTAEYRPSEGARIFGRASEYQESRGNGTPLQVNDTRLRSLSAGADVGAGPGWATARVFRSLETYHQTFSSIAADRSSETLTRAQTVPSSSWGANAQWRAPLGRSELVAGVEWRAVEGASAEDVFAGPVAFSESRGRQEGYGIFASDLLSLGPATVQAAVRLDGWRNFDAERVSRPRDGQPETRTGLPSRRETAVSPRLGAVWRISEPASVFVSAYRGFRAPTLNELYRSFRVGNVTTDANENLRAERSTGGEIGADARAGAVATRATAYAVWIDDTIANVTLSTTPSLIHRQRQNVGRTRTVGLELDAEARISPSLRLRFGYLFADARVVDFAADRELESRRVPQVPRHQASLLAAWESSFGRAAVQVRASSAQFEDDQNHLRLAPAVCTDILLARRITSGLEAFAAVENVFNSRAETGKTPTTTIGPPRLFRAGLRLRLS